MNRIFITLLAAATSMVAFAASETPAAPTNLKLAQDENFTVELSWTLPAAYTDGAAFAEGTEVSAVKVFRNNKEIALLNGAATSYSDPLESETNSEGHGFGLCVYEVTACVDNVWSAPCLPEQIMVGEAIATTPLPWDAQLKLIPDSEFDYLWSSNSDDWSSTERGLEFNCDSGAAVCNWLVASPSAPLALLPRRTYQLEYVLVSDVNLLYSAGLLSGSYTEVSDTEFIQVLASNRLAGKDAEVHTVEFVYEPEYWTGAPVFALNICVPAGSGELKATLSSVKISPVESSSAVDAVVPANATDFEVYNLQGVYLGKTSSKSLDAYAPGMYIVRYRSGDTTGSAKIAVR